MSEERDIVVGMDETEQLTDLEAVHRALLSGDITLEVDPAAIAKRIVEQIITAPDVEHAFAEPAVWHAKETVGMTFVLRGVRWYPSGMEGGPALFAAVDAVDTHSGEVGIVTTSAYKHLAKLYVLARDQGFPVTVRISTTSRPTAGGFYPLDFELVTESEG